MKISYHSLYLPNKKIISSCFQWYWRSSIQCQINSKDDKYLVIHKCFCQVWYWASYTDRIEKWPRTNQHEATKTWCNGAGSLSRSSTWFKWLTTDFSAIKRRDWSRIKYFLEAKPFGPVASAMINRHYLYTANVRLQRIKLKGHSRLPGSEFDQQRGCGGAGATFGGELIAGLCR